MTQQQQYPPQYPQAPQQGQQPYPPQQAYPPAPAPGYPPQGYPQHQHQYPAQAPAQAPTQPLAQGNLDDYYAQPSASTGPSISWTNADRSQKPVGTSYAGIVARDVTHADVQQQTDFNTKAPLTYRDGRPKFAMKVPLKVQPSPEFPDGEATWWVKGQARDELVRAMAEAGAYGPPQGGAGIVITLVGRRNSGAGLNPANVVQVRYQPPAGAVPQAPVQQPVQYQEQPAQHQEQAPQAPVQHQVQAPQQGFPPAAQPVQPQAPAQQVQQSVAAPGPTPPADLSPEQQELLARLTGGQG